MEKKSDSTQEAPTAEQDARQRAAYILLNVFAGRWNTEGKTRARDSSTAMKIKGTDTYEWLEGGYFLVHYVDVKVGAEILKAIEIIGYDAEGNNYPTHSFDSQGNSGTYQASVHDGIWTFRGKSERATIVIGQDGDKMTAHWEQLTNSQDWVPWMDIELTKEK
ncbi:MAG: DUF1579 family protein [Chitinophagaceae bacterium]|nr:DUF1579 family protein [Chitinophagaceae bacterium]